METFYSYLKNDSKKKIGHVFFVLLFCSLSLVATAKIRYVNPTATGTADGSSWGNASGNLQAMIDASSSIDEVWVMAGTYKPSAYPTGSSGGTSPRDYAFVLKNYVKIYGGFVGNETSLSQRTIAVIAANPSILSGDIGVVGDNSDNVYHVIISVNDERLTTFDGFNIIKGNANKHGTITLEAKSIFQHFGGGMMNHSSSPNIINCNFYTNTTAIDDDNGGRGAGMNNYISSPVIRNCNFFGNIADTGGGIENSVSSWPFITNCSFANNIAYQGGAMFNASDTPFSITNCSFSINNGRYQGGGIYNSVTSPIIINCTFYGNNSNNGGGIYNAFSSKPIIKNSIFWKNSESIGNNNNEFDVPVVSYSDIEGGYAGTGNINQNPLFVNETDPDGADNIFGTADDGLALQSSSPCINAGTSANAPTTDITGYTRTGIFDMGAYEFNPCSTSIIYVNDNATGSNNGTSWANAFTSLESALNAARNLVCPNIQIWVAAGTYKPSAYPVGVSSSDPRDFTFHLPNYVKMYGGFVGTETFLSQRTPTTIAANPSTLNGDIGVVGDNNDNVYHVVLSVNDDSTSVFDGFTITKGNANGIHSINLESQIINQERGGGMYNHSSNIIIENCSFISNNGGRGGGLCNYGSYPKVLNSFFSLNTGGGLYNYSSFSKITNCIFSNNTSDSGGGIQNYADGSPSPTNSRPTINSCIFIANSANFDGGGIKNHFSIPIINDCSFYGNTANQDGGGIKNYYSLVNISNSVFISNSASGGGGISNYEASPTITNCTFYSNLSSYNGGGILNSFRASSNIKNSIFWGNKKSVNIVSSIGGDPATITYSNIEGGYPGIGNINQDPLFVNTSDPDGADNIFGTADDGLALQSCSPAINAGDNSGITATTDITGAARIQNNIIDMGAYEGGYSAKPEVSINPAIICSGTNQLLMASPTNGGANPQYYWSKNNIPQGISPFSLKTTANGLGHNGVYDFFQTKNGNMYAATNGGLSISTNGGTSFVNYSTANGLGSNFVHKVFVSDNGKIYAATVNGLSISNNGGTLFTNYTTANGLGSNITNGVVIDKNGKIYVPTYIGLAISSDGGNSFSNYTTAHGLGSNFVWGVFVANNGKIYAATEIGLSISVDGGNSYINHTNGLVNTEVFDVFVGADETIYAATRGGISISKDGGNTFKNATTANGLGNNWTLGIKVGADGKIYVATEGGVSISCDGGNSFVNYTIPGGFSENLVEYIYIGTDGKIYAPTLGGLAIATQVTSSVLHTINSSPNDVYKVTMVPSAEICSNPSFVSAVKSAINQPQSCTNPTAPSNISATALSNNQIRINWNDNSTNETFFIVERSVDDYSYFGISGNLPPNTTTFNYTELNTNQKYYYRVKATNGDCCWTYSNIVESTIMCSLVAPSNLSASSNSEVVLTWNDNSTNETFFRVERSVDDYSYFGIADLPPNTNRFSYTEPNKNQTFYYRVKATNGDNCVAFSNVVVISSQNTRIGVNNIPDFLNGENKLENIDILVFPNPAERIVNIKLTQSFRNQPITISMLDKRGVIIYQSHIENGTSEIFEIDTKNIYEGEYLIKVESKEHQISKKIVLVN